MIHKRFQPCGTCGVSVPHRYSISLGWHPEEYHDCKPVPGAKLDAANAEIAKLRDLARIGEQAVDALNQLKPQHEKAVALLREVEWSSRQVFCPVCGSSRDFGHSSACRLGALLAGQPTPTTPTTPTPGHTIPANAQKRYLRPTHGGSQWEEADDVGGPWSPVPVADARQASWEKHGGAGQVPPDSELASQGLPPVPT